MHIGTFDWSSTKSTGQFACPTCRSTQGYRHRVTRPFLTLYFIPVIPIGGLTESVECNQCKQRFGPEALSAAQPGSTGMADSLVRDFGLGMAAIMCDDGVIDEAEIESAIFAFPILAGESLTREKLAEYCRWVQQMRLASIEFVRRGCSRWSRPQRVMMLQALFYVASATGELSARRNRTLLACKDLFELTDDEFEGAVQQVLQWN